MAETQVAQVVTEVTQSGKVAEATIVQVVIEVTRQRIDPVGTGVKHLIGIG